jgi:hypothetical protein
MSKPLKAIPKFSSESEERAFWESRKNDSTESTGPRPSSRPSASCARPQKPSNWRTSDF